MLIEEEIVFILDESDLQELLDRQIEPWKKLFVKK
jgi:hypothetical protein